MICPVCGRYAEPDRETGYDGDDMCPKCSEALTDIVDQSVDPIESDLHDLGSVLASLADLVKDCHDSAKLWDVYVELGKIAKATSELQDGVARLHMKACVDGGLIAPLPRNVQ